MTEEIEENVKIKVHFQGKTYEVPAKKIEFLRLLEKQKEDIAKKNAGKLVGFLST